MERNQFPRRRGGGRQLPLTPTQQPIRESPGQRQFRHLKELVKAKRLRLSQEKQAARARWEAYMQQKAQLQWIEAEAAAAEVSVVLAQQPPRVLPTPPTSTLELHELESSHRYTEQDEDTESEGLPRRYSDPQSTRRSSYDYGDENTYRRSSLEPELEYYGQIGEAFEYLNIDERTFQSYARPNYDGQFDTCRDFFEMGPFGVRCIPPDSRRADTPSMFCEEEEDDFQVAGPSQQSRQSPSPRQSPTPRQSRKTRPSPPPRQSRTPRPSRSPRPSHTPHPSHMPHPSHTPQTHLSHTPQPHPSQDPSRAPHPLHIPQSHPSHTPQPPHTPHPLHKLHLSHTPLLHPSHGPRPSRPVSTTPAAISSSSSTLASSSSDPSVVRFTPAKSNKPQQKMSPNPQPNKSDKQQQTNKKESKIKTFLKKIIDSNALMRQSCHRLLEHQHADGEEPPIYSHLAKNPVGPDDDSNERGIKNEAQEEDEATLRQLLLSLQKQVSVMSMNLTAKLDDLQRGDRQLETTVALCEIRTQLQELTKSVESCQSEVSEVKRDMVAIKQELDTVQQVKEEIEELREYVDRLEEHSQRRKLRLLEQGLTFFLSYAILAAVLGMLQFGYNTGVINAPGRNIENFMKDVYKDRYGKDIHEDTVNRLYSIAVSIFAIGGMLGGFSGGMIANRFGRKGGLLLNNILGISGASLMGFTKISHCYEMLFFGRFIIGVNCGLNTSLVPMYISEIAPLNLRGGLGTVNQLAVTVGLLLSQVLGIEQILGTDEGWPILLGLAICPAILQLLLLPACPESPRYLLITRQWEEEARRALRRLRASNQVEEDIEEMRAEERAQQAEASISMRELLCSPTLRAPLLIGVVMQLSQQLSGINAVFYYSTSLFTSSGLTEESAKFATMGIGAIMVGMTLVSLPLMDRTGRRTLHLYGLGGMFIFSIFITISFLIKEMIDWMSYLSVVSTLSFVVFFAVGPGSIPWLITAELFSQGPRPSAMAIAVLVNWMANFVVGIGFPSMKALLENYTFLPFSVFLAIFWIFTYKKVPETKNKTFEEILALFRNSNGRDSFRDSRLYGSMMNCVNALEQQLPPPPPPAPQDEKHDSLSEQSSAGGVEAAARPPPPLPPPRFPPPGNV